MELCNFLLKLTSVLSKSKMKMFI